MAFGFCIKDRDKKHHICKSYIVPYFYRGCIDDRESEMGDAVVGRVGEGKVKHTCTWV